MLSALALGAWALYLRTMAPTVTVDDSGDFALAAHFFGASHPPGYPAFVLLSRLFVTLPLGDAAFRVNLLAAAAAAGAVVLLYLLVEEILSPLDNTGFAPPLLAAMLLAGSGTFWRLATYAEVSTAMTAVSLGTLLLLCRWRRAGGDHSILGASLLAGFSLGIHYVCGLVIWFFCLFALSGAGCRRRLMNRRLVMSCGLLLAIGFSLFLVLPLRSAGRPGYDWGEPRTIKSFRAVVGRSQYGDTSLAAGSAMSRRTAQAGWLAGGIVRQFGTSLPPAMRLGAVCLILLGLCFIWRYDRMLAAALCAAAIVPMGLLAWMLDFEPTALEFFYMEPFFVASYALLFACAGAGAAAIGVIARAADSTTVSAVLLGALFLFPLAAAADNHAVSSRRSALSYYDMALNCLKLPASGDLLLVRGDPYTFSMWYLQLVAGRRRDVVVFNTTLGELPWHRAFLERWYPDHRSLFAAGCSRERLVETWLERGRAVFSVFNDELPTDGAVMEPYGPLYRVRRPGRTRDDAESCALAGTVWPRCRLRGLRRYPPGKRMYDAELVEQAADRFYNTGTVCIRAGDYRAALRYLSTAARYSPFKADIFINTGMSYYHLGRLEDAAGQFEHAVQCDPRNVQGWQNLIIITAMNSGVPAAQRTAVRAAGALRDRPEILENLARNLAAFGYAGPAETIRKGRVDSNADGL